MSVCRWITQRRCRSAVTTVHRAISFAQSASDMFAGFTFGATMHGFFIPAATFFGGMVVTGGGGVEGER
jgi:hypothetical protein